MSGGRVRVACTLGDPNGVGPEVVLKALAHADVHARIQPVVVGSRAALDAHADLLNAAERSGRLEFVEIGGPFTVRPGVIDGEAGRLSMLAVATAVDLCMDGHVQAMVTAPISKEAIVAGGYRVPGHTEFIADRCGADTVTMMMVSDGLRVALVTSHVPLSRVAAGITGDIILERLGTVHASLMQDFAIDRPRIAVLGLNPHAGDGGVLGTEERDIIEPALAAARDKGWDVEGPFPADGFFGSRSHLAFDAVLAMYHDQGLVPFKSLTFERGVNFSAGLPLVRTSPDHGTAFAIAGQGIAREASFRIALDTASHIVLNRQR